MTRDSSDASEMWWKIKIIRFLRENNGNWWNKNQIYDNLPGPRINRGDIKKICDVFSERNFLDKRKSEDKRVEHEYKISSEGIGYVDNILSKI